jgi:recombination protein RecR
MEFSSKLLEQAVYEMSQLPGIGKRTALRLVLHLLKQPKESTAYLTTALDTLRKDIKRCQICYTLSDVDECEICCNQKRDHSLVCVVEDVRDVMAIENTRLYKGVYHVLGGRISPVEGIGPSQLTIQKLVERVKEGVIEEVIFALSANMEGDTTGYYMYKQLTPFQLKISSIARGISVGDEIEYADEVTLGRSIINRVSFESSLKNN